MYIPFGIFLLIINCFFLILFKKWLGPVGIFYSSIFCFIIFLINNFFILWINLISGSFLFIDFGRWFFTMDIITSNLVFCFDNLSIILGSIVIILTIVALFFGIEYMSRETFIARLVFLLNLFATSVLFLFYIYDFFLIIIAWELIGLFSFLLVNFYSLTVYTLKSSLKTFVFSRLSDFFIFIAFNLCILVFNSTDLTLIFLKTPFFAYHTFSILGISINFLTFLTLCISLSGCIKAAQFGFHVWLPDAMNAPTPASSLIHSSTLVIMGIYLIIRLNLIFEFTILTNYFLIIIGGLTISIGSLIAVFQTDIKKLVAYSTISQMGYLVSGCGFCAYDETIIYLLMHAINKAFLFIIVGYTVHFFNNNTDLRQMGSLYIYSYELSIYFLILSMNLIGLPFSSGFYSKEFLLFQVLDNSGFSITIKSFWFISFLFTPIYMFILVYFINFNLKKNIYINYFNNNYKNYDKNNKYSVTSFFENVFINSKSTVFLLFFFYFIFNFFGDYFSLILYNYMYQNESFFVKNYFKLNFKNYLSVNLLSGFNIYNIYAFIVLINLISINYILSIFYKNSTNIINLLYYFDFLLIIVSVFLF